MVNLKWWWVYDQGIFPHTKKVALTDSGLGIIVIVLARSCLGETMSWSRYWFQICFMFTPKIGEDEPILTNMFQSSWNHRPVIVANLWTARKFDHLRRAYHSLWKMRPVATGESTRQPLGGGTAQCTKGTLFVVLIELFQIPMGSMYGLLTCIYHKNRPNAAKYTRHGSCGMIYLLLVNSFSINSTPQPAYLTREMATHQ